MKLQANSDAVLEEGDLIRVEPWTFHFSTRGVPTRGLRAEDDSNMNATFIRSHGPSAPANEKTTRGRHADIAAGIGRGHSRGRR